ncbi:hypothetical protein Btru_075788 [Bulinus truncatus]|nr:hypothetical protein Btru_075788 [Bulinus truncatus]
MATQLIIRLQIVLYAASLIVSTTSLVYVVIKTLDVNTMMAQKFNNVMHKTDSLNNTWIDEEIRNKFGKKSLDTKEPTGNGQHHVDVLISPVTVHKQINTTLQDMSISSRATDHFTLSFDQNIDNPLVEHVRGARVSTEGIHLDYAGTFYVYLSLNFKANSSANIQTFFAYLHRISPNSPSKSGVLMRSAYSCANCTNATETRFTGGVFHLQQGDIIQVCLSEQNAVEFLDDSTFTGLFLLASTTPTCDEVLNTWGFQHSVPSTLGTQHLEFSRLDALNTRCPQHSVPSSLGALNTRCPQHSLPSKLDALNTRCPQHSGLSTLDALNTRCPQNSMPSTLAALNTRYSQHSVPSTLGTLNTRCPQNSVPSSLGALNTRCPQHSVPSTLGTLNTRCPQHSVTSTLGDLNTRCPQH